MVNIVSIERRKAKHCHRNEKENISSDFTLAPDDTKVLVLTKMSNNPLQQNKYLIAVFIKMQIYLDNGI